LKVSISIGTFGYENRIVVSFAQRGISCHRAIKLPMIGFSAKLKP